MVCGKAQTPSTSVILTQEPCPLGEVLVGLLALVVGGAAVSMVMNGERHRKQFFLQCQIENCAVRLKILVN